MVFWEVVCEGQNGCDQGLLYIYALRGEGMVHSAVSQQCSGRIDC